MPIMQVNPARRKRRTTTKKRTTRTTRARKTSKKRSAAAKKAATTRRRKRRATTKLVARTSNPARRRKRRTTTKRRRVRAAAPVRRARRRRANPSKRRYNRRRRANPATGKKLFGRVLHVAGGFFANSALTGLVYSKVPFFSGLPMGLGRPAVSGALTMAAWYAKKKVAAVKKMKFLSVDVIVGMAVNTGKELIAALAPASVKGMIGLGASDIYGPLGDYVQVGEYVQLNGAPPIEDNMALADYVQVGDIEQDLGMTHDLGEFEQGLGDIEQDLGDWATVVPGGVARTGPGSMQAAITQHKQIRAGVPARSFTAPVHQFGAEFDGPGALYAGAFEGGFGR